ncbi:MAG: acylphosphatase [Candidatus Spechtbacterales bacterium]|nr:acylphosphatase [Candidatus Spechtbacterales bacterium]
MKKHLNIRVHGKVQGVFFRATTQDTAQKLGVTGFVRNEPDGTVYIEAEAGKKTLDNFLKNIKEGPRMADVIDIKISEGEVKDFEDFEIRY